MIYPYQELPGQDIYIYIYIYQDKPPIQFILSNVWLMAEIMHQLIGSCFFHNPQIGSEKAP